MAGCVRRAAASGLAKSAACIQPMMNSIGCQPIGMDRTMLAAVCRWTPWLHGYRWGQPCAFRHGPTKTWKDLPQPDLKPIGPEDYHRWRYYLKQKVQPKPEERHVMPEDVRISEEVFRRINEQVATGTTGRLFAVVHVGGKQFKITTNDIIVVQGTFVPNAGQVIRLEKVLAVGSADFTVVGRPLLGKDAVKIEATVIEKTLSNIVTHFRYKRRKQYKRINFFRCPHTMLRINDISIVGRVNETKEVEGLDNRIVT